MLWLDMGYLVGLICSIWDLNQDCWVPLTLSVLHPSTSSSSSLYRVGKITI